MYVEEFVGDSLDQALKAVKEKLGPDAIILKTVTNKGLKGALKKNKIQITAAISEKSYVKKAKVDKVMDADQKKNFYAQNAKDVSRYIDGYNGLGLNKVVNSIGTTTKKTAEKIKMGLDDFLGADIHESPSVDKSAASVIKREKAVRVEFPQEELVETPFASMEETMEFNSELHKYQTRISILEKKLQDVLAILENQKEQVVAQPQEESSVKELKATLKSLEITDAFIQQVLKKARMDMTERELADHDTLFEYALREMAASINTAMPLFSSTDESMGSVVTVLVSEVASGQSSMAVKLASLKKNSVLITCGSEQQMETQHKMATRLFGFEVENATSTSEIYSICRKAVERNKHVFIDYKNLSTNKDESKHFVEGIKRAFGNVEILLSLSAIHSEFYNRKIISKYNELLDGAIISHVDLCLNYGSLFNIHYTSNNIPVKFFGTGVVVPDDIETATPERILAGMFKF